MMQKSRIRQGDTHIGYYRLALVRRRESLNCRSFRVDFAVDGDWLAYRKTAYFLLTVKFRMQVKLIAARSRQQQRLAEPSPKLQMQSMSGWIGIGVDWRREESADPALDYCGYNRVAACLRLDEGEVSPRSS